MIYEVELVTASAYTIRVEAESEEEAIVIAEDDLWLHDPQDVDVIDVVAYLID